MMGKLTQARRLLVVACAGVLLAGCGSTAQLSGTNAANGLGANGVSNGTGANGVSGGTGAGVPGTSEAANGAPPTNQPGVVAGSNGGGSTVPGQPGSTSSGGGTGITSSGGTIPVKGRGWDAKNVYLGFAIQSDFSATAKAAGVKGLDTGDPRVAVNAILADINSHGGLLGRKIVPLYQDTNTATGSQNAATSAQVTCTYFTQDHPVIAVENFAGSLSQKTLYACLAKAQTPAFSVIFQDVDHTSELKNAPFVHWTGVASYDRLMPVWLRRLDALHYYTGWDTTQGKPDSTKPVKIGLFYGQNETASRIMAKLKKQLAADGHPVTTDIKYDDATAQSAAPGASNAVVAFRSAGVTHVFTDTGTSTFLLMAPAQSQNYMPRYAMNSYHAPMVTLAPNFPGQMNGAMGVGWDPGSDVAASEDPGSRGATETRCQKEMKDGGFSISGRTAEFAAYLACDSIRLTVEAAVAGGGFDYKSLRSGVIAVGPGFHPAGTFSSGLSASSYSLPGGVRDFAWDATCGSTGCIRYLSKITYGM